MATLAEIRGLMLDQVEGDPAPSTDLVRRANSFIDQAVRRISQEAPYLFHEEQVQMRLEPTLASLTADDTLSIIDQTSPTRTLIEALITDTPATDYTPNRDLPADRSLDGRDIELIDPSTAEVVHRSKIHTVYTVSGNSIITLETPIDLPAIGSGPWKYRIYSRVHYLADDIMQVKSANLMDGSSVHEMQFVHQATAEERWFAEEIDTQTSGVPYWVFRRDWFKLPGPSREAAVTLGDSSQADERWLGPEPPGAFQYCFTFTWGKRTNPIRISGIGFDDEDGTAYATAPLHLSSDYNGPIGVRNRVMQPRFESSPSPITSTITVPSMTSDADWTSAVKLVFPNIAYAMGRFFVGATDSDDATAFGRATVAGLGGIHIRVYRRRLTEDFAFYDSLGGATKGAGSRIGFGASSTVLSRMEFNNSFQLLAEIPIEQLNQGEWFDNGTITPAYDSRLPEVNGYQGLRFYPIPDQPYDVRLRVLRRPESLENDTDAPRLPYDATQLIVEAAKVLYFEHLREPGLADRAQKQYRDLLDVLSRRYGDLTPEHETMHRRPARSLRFRNRGYRRTRRETE